MLKVDMDTVNPKPLLSARHRVFPEKQPSFLRFIEIWLQKNRVIKGNITMKRRLAQDSLRQELGIPT